MIPLFDQKSNSLYFGSGRGFKPGRATTALRYLQNPLLERVVAERQVLHMPIPHDWLDIWASEGFSDYFGVPLWQKARLTGYWSCTNAWCSAQRRLDDLPVDDCRGISDRN